MAEFTTVVKERNRMCKHFDQCSDCPLDKLSPCRYWVIDHPEEAEKLIMKWSKENPIMTNRRKFEEIFGFNIATMFEVNRGNVEWLEAEYVNKEKED